MKTSCPAYQDICHIFFFFLVIRMRLSCHCTCYVFKHVLKSIIFLYRTLKVSGFKVWKTAKRCFFSVNPFDIYLAWDSYRWTFERGNSQETNKNHWNSYRFQISFTIFFLFASFLVCFKTWMTEFSYLQQSNLNQTSFC